MSSANLHLSEDNGRSGPLQPRQHLCVSVADSGSGIDAETMKHVFEPFFTTKEIGKGTGLGLSQVYGFARGAGGDTEIETQLGRGTVFRIILPRSKDGIINERKTPSPEQLLPASDETVLIVEDDEQVLSLATERLEELNYRVLVARNAKEALVHIRGQARIDIMFSDVVMPGGMNGGQLAALARTVHRQREEENEGQDCSGPPPPSL